MNAYYVYLPTYKQDGPVWCKLTFTPVRRITAPSAEDAIAVAKRLGYISPVIGPAKARLQ